MKFNTRNGDWNAEEKWIDAYRNDVKHHLKEQGVTLQEGWPKYTTNEPMVIEPQMEWLSSHQW